MSAENTLDRCIDNEQSTLLVYKKADGRRTARVVCPYEINPVQEVPGEDYLIAWDGLRGGIRNFRISRTTIAVGLPAGLFPYRPKED